MLKIGDDLNPCLSWHGVQYIRFRTKIDKALHNLSFFVLFLFHIFAKQCKCLLHIENIVVKLFTFCFNVCKIHRCLSAFKSFEKSKWIFALIISSCSTMCPDYHMLDIQNVEHIWFKVLFSITDSLIEYIHPNRQYFVLLFKDKPLELWDLRTQNIIRELPKQFPRPTTIVSFQFQM